MKEETTKGCVKMPEGPTIQDDIEQMKIELQLYGFAVAKYIVIETNLPLSGTIECPMCHATLHYSIADSNGHMRAKCSRDGCLNMVE